MAKEYSNALPIGYQLNGEYVIESVLEVDGFSITYLANDISLTRPVVIREYFPKYTALREGQAAVVPKSRNDKKVIFGHWIGLWKKAGFLQDLAISILSEC